MTKDPLRLILAIALLAAACCRPAAALAPGEWQAAELYGADVRSLAIEPGHPDVIYAGTSAGQLYRSEDGGASWQDVRRRPPFVGWVVAALRFDPNHTSRLWAGLWGVWGGGMVAFSDDRGTTWTYRQSLPAGQVYSLALVPGRPGKVLIGTRRGVFASLDDGATWSHLTAAMPEIEKITSLLVAADAPGTILAGSWQCAYKSEDGGRSWRGLFKGMLRDSEVFSLTPVPGERGGLWASTCGWVYKSRDGGEEWSRFKEGMATRRVPSFAVLAGGRLAAGTTGGLYLSDDDGLTWRLATDPALAILAIATTPERPDRLLLGTEGSGVWVSEDRGITFTRAARGMTNVRVAALAALGRELVAAVNHAGPSSGIYSSIDHGRSFQLQRGGMATTLALAVAGDELFAATEGGLFERGPDYDWRPVPQFGSERIEDVAFEGGRLLVRTAAGTFERAGDRFVPALRRPGAAPVLEKLAALRLPDQRNSRVLPTGDARYGALLLAREGSSLLDLESGARLPLELPVLAEDVTAARLIAGLLVLGTSGSGVQLHRMLEAAPAAP